MIPRLMVKLFERFTAYNPDLITWSHDQERAAIVNARRNTIEAQIIENKLRGQTLMTFTDHFANFLIGAAPYSVWIKTLAFGLIWITAFFQDAVSKLGVWLNLFFFFTFLTSASVALFAGRVLGNVEYTDITGAKDWFILISINALPLLTSLCGIMVAYYASKIEAQCIDCLDDVVGTPNTRI